MRKIAFSDRWVTVIVICVHTVTYTVFIKGKQSSWIISTRGLKQEDPLSPYLFLLYLEGLSCLLNREDTRGLIRGVAVLRQVPRDSHLLFADDNVLFCRVSIQECHTA